MTPMTTTLPTDPETERLAQKLAEVKGCALSAVVREAIEASARDAGVLIARRSKLSAAEKRQRLIEIADRSAARPIRDPRTAEEILGYDEHGLPA
jgi:antitoxin VapB